MRSLYTDTFDGGDEKAPSTDAKRMDYHKEHDTYWMKKTLEDFYHPVWVSYDR